MLIGEIPKNTNIVLRFHLTKRWFEVPLNVIQNTYEKEGNAIYTEPIVVCGIVSKFSQGYHGVSVKYQNVLTGITYIWTDIKVEYHSSPFDYYRITSERESTVLENRRAAVRVPVNIEASCRIGNGKGMSPCTVHDLSIYGVGVNLDLRFAGKNIVNQMIYVTFCDQELEQTYEIYGICTHTTPLKKGLIRCGCKIIEVKPSINEYVSTRQTAELIRAANRRRQKEKRI